MVHVVIPTQDGIKFFHVVVHFINSRLSSKHYEGEQIMGIQTVR
jgi:hypothetical protein